MRKFVPSLGIVAFVLAVASAASAESVIIKCKRPCTAIVQAVEQNGGVVIYRYKYVDAIAADVTTTALSAVRGIAELGAVRKDHLMQLPSVANEQRGAPGWAQVDATTGPTSIGRPWRVRRDRRRHSRDALFARRYLLTVRARKRAPSPVATAYERARVGWNRQSGGGDMDRDREWFLDIFSIGRQVRSAARRRR